MEIATGALDFFEPNKKTHINRLNSILPYIIMWRHMGEMELPMTYLNRIFNSNSGLGRKFKEALLIETDSSWSNYAGNEYSKKYKVNQINSIQLINQAGQSIYMSTSFPDMTDDSSCNNWIADYFCKKYELELAGQKEFEYTEKSQRLWHELQRMKREVKDIIFSRYPMYEADYDISTSLITHMLGECEKLDKKFDKSRYHLVYEYKNNRKQIREKVAEILEVDVDTAKKLFSYINNNGQISASPQRGLMRIVGNDRLKVEQIRRNRFFTKYRLQIRSLWRTWLTFSNLAASFSGQARPAFISKKKKYHLYFWNERRALNVITEFLVERGHKFFLEHDGFRSDRGVDINELEKYLFSKLEIEIKLD